MTSETIAWALILAGAFFDLFGCIGLVRFPDVYNRIQAGTKCVTLGTCTILLGTCVWAFGAEMGALGVKALMCAAFVLLTSPVGAHAMARGAYLAGVKAWEGTVVDRYAEYAGASREEAEAELAETMPEAEFELEGASSDAKAETARIG